MLYNTTRLDKRMNLVADLILVVLENNKKDKNQHELNITMTEIAHMFKDKSTVR